MKTNSKTKFKFEKALLMLLEKKHYHDITINEICDAAKKSKMTFYRYYKDKEHLLAEASISLINKEYNEAIEKIIRKETDFEEIGYQTYLKIYGIMSDHYNQIENLIYKGDVFPLEIFEEALLNNYKKYITEQLDLSGYGIPNDIFSIFFFEGLFNSAIYNAKQLKISNNKEKVEEDCKKMCRLLTEIEKAIVDVNK